MLSCNTIYIKKAVKVMAFQLNIEKKESETKTIRFPLPLVEKIEKYLEGTESNFSRFVIQACEYVLKEIEEEQKKKN